MWLNDTIVYQKGQTLVKYICTKKIVLLLKLGGWALELVRAES